MTLPDERYLAMKWGREFLFELLDPKKTPRVPKDVRRQALHILRYYPYDYHFDVIAEKVPEWFSKKTWMEQLNESKNRTV